MVTLRTAMLALLKNKLRASLTVLGVVIGIAAVTTMVSIGESASIMIQSQFQALGTNVLAVYPSTVDQGGVSSGSVPTLTAADAIAIAQHCPSVLATSPVVGAVEQVIHGNDNWNPKQMQGVGKEYPLVRQWNVRLGGFFVQRDVDTADKVCVIGQTVAEKLFQTTNPIGSTVRIRKIPFRVIGVLEAKGASIVGEDQDDVLLMPYSTMRKRLLASNFDDVNAIILSATSVSTMSTAEMEIRQLLEDRHRCGSGEDSDFRVQNTTEIGNILRMITFIMTAMLSSIAGISLVVGGVGIMNIMLVSVTERTREIGLRMAVGARGRDILFQFLIESVLLSLVGGVIGLLLGIAGSVGLTMLINNFSAGAKWPVVISIPAAVIAVLFAGAVGVFFGFYPARCASQLDPIDALRYE